MKNICLYFQIHHPFNLQTFRFFDIGESKSYYNYGLIEKEIQAVSENYYIPTNDYLFRLIHHHRGKLKLSFNISATALELFLIYSPRLISSFRQLAETGQVEFTGNVASHSIVSLSDEEQIFLKDIKQSQQRIEYYFGQKPTLFVNTDLLFTNQIAKNVAKTEYQAILTNGINRILQWRSPNYLYSSESQSQIKVLFRNEKISNDLEALLNFESQSPEELIHDFNVISAEEPIVNIYLNYNVLGGINRQKKYKLFSEFVSRLIRNKAFCFELPSEIISSYGPISEISTDEPVCWVEGFHSSYYPENELQKEAMKQLFKLAKKVESAKNNSIKIDWQYLQTSDHFHLMDHSHPDYQHEKQGGSLYKSKYDAYINFMNILSDFKARLKIEAKGKKKALTPNLSTKSHTITEFK
jgi:alpha-amylase